MHEKQPNDISMISQISLSEMQYSSEMFFSDRRDF